MKCREVKTSAPSDYLGHSTYFISNKFWSKALLISAVTCCLLGLKRVLVIISMPPPVSEVRIEDAGRKGMQGESIYCHFPLTRARLLHIILI